MPVILFRFELALQQNEIMDVFYDDYMSLAEEDSTFGSKSDNYLKVHIDKHLSWSIHIKNLTKKIASAIDALKRIRPFITTKTAVQVYQVLIQPHFDNCCSVWDAIGETLSNKIQKLQNMAVRVITRSGYDINASFILNNLNLDNLCLRRKKIKAGIMFKILVKSDAPSYLQNLFSIRGTGYNLRNSEIKLSLPKPRTNYLKRSLSYSGAVLWNSLPKNIRMLSSLPLFKKTLSQHYI